MLLLTRGELFHVDPWIQTIGYSAFAAFFGGVVLSVVVSGASAPLQRSLNHPALRALGKYSYALYVTHWMIGVLLIEWLTRDGDLPTVFDSQIPSRLAFLVAGSALSIGAAGSAGASLSNRAFG